MPKFIEAAYRTIKAFLRRYGERSVGAFSAQAAFFLFIAFFPFAVLLFYVINLLPAANEQLSSEALDIIPKLFGSIFSEAQEQAQSNAAAQTAILLVSAAAALWAASKGIYAITLGLDSAYGIKENRNPLLVRLKSALYTLCFVLLLILTLALLVFGNILNDKLNELFPAMSRLVFLVRTFRFVFVLFLLTGFFALTYRFLPNSKRSFSSAVPGAVLSAVGWIVFSFLYSLYIDNYNTDMSIYGSLAAIVLLMLWLYFCMNILLSGALLNSWLDENTSSK